MSLFDPRTAKVLFTIGAFVLIGTFLYGVRHTLVLILFAIFFAYLLAPLVLYMQNSKLARGSRSVAILETYLAIGIVFTVLIVLFGPRLVADARRFSATLPSLLDRVTTGTIVWQFGSAHGWSYDTQVRIEQFIAAHQSDILSWSSQVGTAVAKSLQNVVWVILIPILAIFFLHDGPRLAEEFLCVFDKERQRRFLRGVINDLDEILAQFIRSQLIMAGISLVMYCSVFTLMRLPYALVLGLAAGIMEFIPVVGPLVAAVVIVTIGFLSSYPHLFLLVLFFGVWRVIQDYIVSPRIMGGKLELHPLGVIVAVLMGGELGGVLGVYLSIPLAAIIRMLWVRWQKYSAANLATVQAEAPDRLRPSAALLKQ